MRTEKGRLSYQMNLEQIRNAVLETVYIGVIEAYLKCKTVGSVRHEIYNGQMSYSKVMANMAREVEDWATVQKNEFGFELLDSRLKRRMRLQVW